MNLYKVIKNIYPEIDDDEFVLKDDADGRGPYILRWESELPKPTQEEIEAVWEEVKKIPIPEETPSEIDQLKSENVELRQRMEAQKQQMESLSADLQGFMDFFFSIM